MTKKNLIMLSIFCAMCAASCDYNELGGYYKFNEKMCIQSHGNYYPETDECRCPFNGFTGICEDGRVCDINANKCIICEEGATYCEKGKLHVCRNDAWEVTPCPSNECIEQGSNSVCKPTETKQEDTCSDSTWIHWINNAPIERKCLNGCDGNLCAKCNTRCENNQLLRCMSDCTFIEDNCQGAGCNGDSCNTITVDDKDTKCDPKKDDNSRCVEKNGIIQEEECKNGKWTFHAECKSNKCNGKYCECDIEERPDDQCIDNKLNIYECQRGSWKPMTSDCADGQTCDQSTGQCMDKEKCTPECNGDIAIICNGNEKNELKCQNGCKDGECECPDGCNECSKNGDCSDKITCNDDQDCTNGKCIDNKCIETNECKPRCKTEKIAIACDSGKEKELTCKQNEHCDNGNCVSNTSSCTDKDLKCENGIPTFCKEGEWKSFKDQSEKDGSCAYICRDTSLFKCTDTKIEEIGLNKCDGEYYCDSIIVAQSTPYYTASLCGGECNNGKCLTKQCQEYKYACAPNLKQSCTNDDCCTFIECDDGECIKDNIIDSTIEKPNPKSELCSERTDCTFTAPYRCDENKGSIEFLDDTTCSYNKITPNSEQETKYKSIESKQFFCKNLYNDQYHYCDNQDTQNEQATEMKELCGECVNNMDLMLNNSTVKIKTIAFKDDYICKEGLQAVFDSECINTNSRCSLKKSNITLFCIRGANNLYYEFKISTCLGIACQYTLTPCVNGCDEKFERCNPDATIPTNPPGEEPG